jgi:D-arabinose 1-dehydrogenase-like Zn-dependent alcohol dehydrogenase
MRFGRFSRREGSPFGWQRHWQIRQNVVQAAQIPIRTTTQVFLLEEANKVLQLLKAGKIDGAAILKI